MSESVENRITFEKLYIDGVGNVTDINNRWCGCKSETKRKAGTEQSSRPEFNSVLSSWVLPVTVLSNILKEWSL